jgi:hypothetical protein
MHHGKGGELEVDLLANMLHAIMLLIAYLLMP